MYALGIDPDLHTCGWAFVNDGCKVRSMGTARVLKEHRGFVAGAYMGTELHDALLDARDDGLVRPAAIVVETQKVYLGTKVRPQDLVSLAFGAGAAMQAAVSVYPSVDVLLPEPGEWKGSIPKAAFTRRLRARFGLPAGKVNVHVVDACGLAWWGLTHNARTSARAQFGSPLPAPRSGTRTR